MVDSSTMPTWVKSKCLSPHAYTGLFVFPATTQPTIIYYYCYRVVLAEEYDTINQIVQKIVAEKQPFERLAVPKEVALEMFKVHRFVRVRSRFCCLMLFALVLYSM